MSTICLMIGIIASGKSTWAKKHVDSNTFIVSKDNIREMIYGQYDYKVTDEHLVDDIAKSCIKTLLEQGSNVIIDECWDTMTRGSRIRLIKWLYAQGAHQVEMVWCSSTQGNVGRQIKSKGWTQELAEEVYDKMMKEFEHPESWECYGHLEEVNIDEN